MGIKLDFGAMSNTLEAQANHSGYTLGEYNEAKYCPQCGAKMQIN